MVKLLYVITVASTPWLIRKAAVWTKVQSLILLLSQKELPVSNITVLIIVLLCFSCKAFLWNKLQKWNNKKGWKSVTLQCVSGAKYKKNGVRQLRRIQIPWRMLTNMWFFMYIHVQYSFSIDEIRMCTMNFELVHVLFRIISSMEKMYLYSASESIFQNDFYFW